MTTGFGNVKDIPFNLCSSTYSDIPNGVPALNFIANLDTFLTSNDSPKIDDIITVLKTLLEKFKYYEVHLTERKKTLKSKLPETYENIEQIKYLQKSQDNVELDFLLADGVYSTCEVEKGNDKVGLWLGANVMVEYTYEEAKEMLGKNVKTIETRLENLNNELDFVKDQITTTEVTMARFYNYDVKTRREANITS
eukprot:snap_masked-scaffold_29-processed-gene-1.39-mRNA-1 protein AED:0.07 eAED:0.07 QI:0/-1/0/1/-1/1/1/0/194